MRPNRKQDAKPETPVRSVLHSEGFRFRKHELIRLIDRTVRPDIVFSKQHVAVSIDGCFWHACPLHGNKLQTNSEYWLPKLTRNVERDRAVDSALADAGWSIVRAWEHESPLLVADRVIDAIRGVADGRVSGSIAA
jgi:DNA mismatch endonuclease (patch repair protein)